MKLRDFLGKLDDMTDAEREVYASSLVEQLTDTSVRTLVLAQVCWKGDTFEDFKKEQNDELRVCVALEESEIGIALRMDEGLTPLTGDTILG